MSNLGTYGIDSFIGIVPPPTSTILSIGNIIPTIVCDTNRTTMQKTVSMTVAIDNRVIDSSYAAEFLDFIREQLQNPQQLV